MSQRIKKCRDELCYLANCSDKNRKYIIKGSNSDLINAIGDASLTLIKNKLPLKAVHKRQLKNYIRELQLLATSKVPIAKKKSVLSTQKGGAVLGLLWNIIKNII